MALNQFDVSARMAQKGLSLNEQKTAPESVSSVAAAVSSSTTNSATTTQQQITESVATEQDIEVRIETPIIETTVGRTRDTREDISVALKSKVIQQDITSKSGPALQKLQRKCNHKYNTTTNICQLCGKHKNDHV